jgi:hypothetical protein
MIDGFFPRLREKLFGSRTAKLREELSATSWLSYLLVLTQSAAVVLVLGHSEIPLLLTGDMVMRAVVALTVFVLVATVYAADMALLMSLKRIPVLARNRSGLAVTEHVAFVLFVLGIEASTYAVVLAVLDSNPSALLGNWRLALHRTGSATCYARLLDVASVIPRAWEACATAHDTAGEGQRDCWRSG